MAKPVSTCAAARLGWLHAAARCWGLVTQVVGGRLLGKTGRLTRSTAWQSCANAAASCWYKNQPDYLRGRRQAR